MHLEQIPRDLQCTTHHHISIIVPQPHPQLHVPPSKTLHVILHLPLPRHYFFGLFGGPVVIPLYKFCQKIFAHSLTMRLPMLSPSDVQSDIYGILNACGGSQSWPPLQSSSNLNVACQPWNLNHLGHRGYLYPGSIHPIFRLVVKLSLHKEIMPVIPVWLLTDPAMTQVVMSILPLWMPHVHISRSDSGVKKCGHTNMTTSDTSTDIDPSKASATTALGPLEWSPSPHSGSVTMLTPSAILNADDGSVNW